MTTIHGYNSLQNHQLPFTIKATKSLRESQLPFATTNRQHSTTNHRSYPIPWSRALRKQNNDSQVSPPTIKETSGLTTHHQRNTRFNHSHHQRNTHTHLRACTHTSIVMVTSAMHLSRDLTDKLTTEVCTSPSLSTH